MIREQLFNYTIDEVSSVRYDEIKNRIDNIPKTKGSLGKFEDLLCKIGCAQHLDTPDIARKALVVMCADNGIIEEGITDVGGYMTGLIAGKMAENSAIVSYMAGSSDIKILPVDIGINGDINIEGIINKKISKGTNNFLKESAMTEEQVLKAIETGIEIVRELHDDGYGIICTGDTGIGNATTSVALICAILDGDPSVLTGNSATLSDTAYKKKIDVISEGLHKYGYDRDDIGFESMGGIAERIGHEPARVLDMLKNIGGLDIAGLVGVFIGGAIYHVPVVVDGIISASAALTADSLLPGVRNYMICSHFGKEPATEIVFTELELDPVITAEMSLGEGTGAVMLMPLLDMVMRVFDGLAPKEPVLEDKM